MSSRIYKRIKFCIYLVIAYGMALTANAAQILQNDPFRQPEFAVMPQKVVANASKSVKEVWLPQLRATIRAGNGSMANINGEIIKIGEKIDGFKLVEVHERDAFFIKDGTKYHVSMDQEIDNSLR